jgi:predicted kinase
MSYKNRIITLTESLKLLDARIKDLNKNNDSSLLNDAVQQKVTLEREISRLQRLEWEEQTQRIDLDDDR